MESYRFERSLSMVACGLNEEELIEEFLEKSIRDLRAVCDDWEIVFLNDGSTDRTSELAQAAFARFPLERGEDTRPVGVYLQRLELTP